MMVRCSILVGLVAACVTVSLLTAQSAAPPVESVSFYGNPKSPISSGVVVPAGHRILLTSGTVPPISNKDAPAGSPERYGDTHEQAFGIFKSIESQLQAQSLTLSDVIYLRVYVVADSHRGGKPDFEGFFRAYGEFFGTDANPTKPARSTLAVAALVNPDWLIEIEAVAVKRD